MCFRRPGCPGAWRSLPRCANLGRQTIADFVLCAIGNGDLKALLDRILKIISEGRHRLLHIMLCWLLLVVVLCCCFVCLRVVCFLSGKPLWICVSTLKRKTKRACKLLWIMFQSQNITTKQECLQTIADVCFNVEQERQESLQHLRKFRVNDS